MENISLIHTKYYFFSSLYQICKKRAQWNKLTWLFIAFNYKLIPSRREKADPSGLN